VKARKGKRTTNEGSDVKRDMDLKGGKHVHIIAKRSKEPIQWQKGPIHQNRGEKWGSSTQDPIERLNEKKRRSRGAKIEGGQDSRTKKNNEIERIQSGGDGSENSAEVDDQFTAHVNNVCGVKVFRKVRGSPKKQNRKVKRKAPQDVPPEENKKEQGQRINGVLTQTQLKGSYSNSRRRNQGEANREFRTKK